MNKKKIGIVGVGIVGGTLFNFFPEALLYDIIKYPKNKEIISEADIIFICVPTPYNEQGHDLSMVESAIDNIKGEKIIVIKSTVLPGTTKLMQEKYPQHKILFNPEFLTEVNAEKDFLNPDRQLIGYTEKSKDIAEEILVLLPQADFSRIMPATEAELVKYFSNAFLATKVIFANQVYDICEKMNLNYNNVKETTAADKRIGPSHLDVLYEGFRGYGGKCFPKDIRSLIQLSERLELDPKLWKVVEEINNNLINNRKK